MQSYQWGDRMTERGSQYIVDASELEERQVVVHWHWREKKYSVSVRAENGRWYVVRSLVTGEQLLFGKLVLMNAHFKVQHAGAKKAFETGKRNVHASVIGTCKTAVVERQRAVVPCGRPVMYSHDKYPQPVFKTPSALPARSFEDLEMRNWPSMEWAEMLACGTDPEKKTPQMLAAGMMRLG